MARKPRKQPLETVPERKEDVTAETVSQAIASTPTRPTRALYLLKAIALIVLAAAYSPVSQLSLSPVYGSVGANVYHDKGLIATVLLTIFARGEIADYVPTNIDYAVPILALWIPSIQYMLFQYSAKLGNPNGPFWTECLTCYPLVAISVYVALQYIDAAAFTSFQLGGIDISLPTCSFLFFAMVKRALKGPIFNYVGTNIFATRIGMQMTIGILYASILPSSHLWPAFPSVAFTTLGNVHAPLEQTTTVLNGILASYNYTLLERRESLTGYISVLENNHLGFRAMRCDHSLLGGEWITKPRKGQQATVKEPIYAIFAMLEAVRLVKTEGDPSVEPRALNIGLGIGTAPTAMMAHGIQTDVIELDPVVSYFASKYFGVPPGIKTEIGDAVENVQDKVGKNISEIYDYIIHDVFTGGAEPVSLFTVEFLSNLETLLKPNGVIAINYAGDLAMPSASMIYRTINSVFPSCRVFREVEAPSATSKAVDFTNMVFFCTKRKKPVEFRRPLESDFLGSGARQEHLFPKHEIAPEKFQQKGDVLSLRNTKELEKWQVRSAIGHWKVMRTVIPAAVWENW